MKYLTLILVVFCAGCSNKGNTANAAQVDFKHDPHVEKFYTEGAGPNYWTTRHLHVNPTPVKKRGK